MFLISSFLKTLIFPYYAYIFLPPGTCVSIEQALLLSLSLVTSQSSSISTILPNTLNLHNCHHISVLSVVLQCVQEETLTTVIISTFKTLENQPTLTWYHQTEIKTCVSQQMAMKVSRRGAVP